MPNITLAIAPRSLRAQLSRAKPVFSHSPTPESRQAHEKAYLRFRHRLIGCTRRHSLAGYDLVVHREFITVTWQGRSVFDLEVKSRDS